MEDKVIEAINHVRNKNKQRVTKERIFNHITKAETSIDQGQLMEPFESMKDNSVIFNKQKGKKESYLLLIRITINGSLVINITNKSEYCDSS